MFTPTFNEVVVKQVANLTAEIGQGTVEALGTTCPTAGFPVAVGDVVLFRRANELGLTWDSRPYIIVYSDAVIGKV